MNGIIDIEEYMPHVVREVICLKCLSRWIAVYPEKVLLKQITCQKCEQAGYVIATGQEIMEDEE